MSWQSFAGPWFFYCRDLSPRPTASVAVSFWWRLPGVFQFPNQLAGSGKVFPTSSKLTAKALCSLLGAKRQCKPKLICIKWALQHGVLKRSINFATTSPHIIDLALKNQSCDVISPMHSLTSLKMAELWCPLGAFSATETCFFTFSWVPNLIVLTLVQNTNLVTPKHD